MEAGRLCGEHAKNHGIWLKRVLPMNARIEFDAISQSPDCDLKAEVWGDGRSYATQISYTNAKADSDAVIAGLITALSAGQAPQSLPSLQTKLSGGASGLHEFCDMASNLVPKTAGQTERDVLVDIGKLIPFEQLLKMLSDGVSALYNNHRNDDALTRRTIQTQLEAARWPAFSEVKAAP